MSNFKPARLDFDLYRGDTFDYTLTFNENDSALDLTAINDISVKLYLPSQTIFEHTVSGGDLTISGADDNILSGVAYGDTMDIAIRRHFFEVTFIYSSSPQDETTYAIGNPSVIDVSNQSGAGPFEFIINVDDSAGTATAQMTANYAAAVQAKNDAEAAESGSQTAESNSETWAEGTDSAVGQLGGTHSSKGWSEEANTYSDLAEQWANEDEDVVVANSEFSAKHYSIKASDSASAASTSESNAAASKAESQDNADDAEKQAQNTTSFTDSDGNSFDKGAKGYSEDAAASASTAQTAAEDEVQDKRTEDDAFYFTQLASKHNTGDPLWLPESDPADVTAPPSGYQALFLDSTNSNALTAKDSNGNTTTL